MDRTPQTKKYRIQQLQKAFLTFLILLLLFIAVRDALPDIWQQLKATSPGRLAHILLASVFYHFMEGLLTTIITRKHLSEFSLKTGIQCAFYCSFYRVVTFGSGAGAAGVYFLHQNRIDTASATGIYMVQYVLHRISTTLYALLLLLLNFSFMYSTYYQYGWFLVIGLIVTILVVSFLLAICLSSTFHKLICRLCIWAKGKGLKINPDAIREKSELLKNTAALLMADKKLLCKIIFINFIKLSFWFCIPFLILHDNFCMSLTTSLCMTSMMTALAGVIPTPAGIGSIEFVYMLLFTPITGTAAAAASMLLYRFATYYFPILPGGIVILIRKLNSKKDKVMLP